MSEPVHDIPADVKQFGRLVVNWTEHDLTKLRMLSRCGFDLEKVSRNLPCLWYFKETYAAEILEQSIERDPLVSRCLHENLGSGKYSELAEGETDEVLSQAELLEYDDVFSSLRNTLLELPKQEFERILGVLLEELTAVKTPKPAAAKPRRSPLANADRPKRKSAGGQNRCSEAEVDRRILQAANVGCGLSPAMIAKIVSPLQTRAREREMKIYDLVMEYLQRLQAQGLGEISGTGKSTRFVSRKMPVPEMPPTGLQAVRELSCVA